MQKKPQQSGFTLVELAIVLVIIGLIVGGVLVGQDLIKAATLRAATAQLDKIDAAANTFRNKYNALPGDLPNPDSFFAGVTDGSSAVEGLGNGDGAVSSVIATSGGPPATSATPCASSACISGEALVFWAELAAAGLITEPITTTVSMTDLDITINDYSVPPSKLGKGARITVNAASGRNYYVLGNPGSSTSTGAATWTQGVSGIDAFNLDTKVDDGVPTTGKLRSLATGAPDADPSVTAGNGLGTLADGVCYESDLTPARYNTGAFAENMNCILGIRTSF